MAKKSTGKIQDLSTIETNNTISSWYIQVLATSGKAGWRPPAKHRGI